MSIYDDPGALFRLWTTACSAVATPSSPIPNWDELPEELLIEIFQKFSPQELRTKRGVNTKWKRIIDHRNTFPIHYLFYNLISEVPQPQTTIRNFYYPRRYNLQYIKGCGFYYSFDHESCSFHNQRLFTTQTYVTPQARNSNGCLNITEIFAITTPSYMRYVFTGKSAVKVTGYRVYVVDPAYKAAGRQLQYFFDEHFAASKSVSLI